MSFKSPNAKFMLRLNKLSKVCKYSNIVFKYGSHRLALVAIPRYSTPKEEKLQRLYHVFSWTKSYRDIHEILGFSKNTPNMLQIGRS
jgi:hypothetical protein